jgi:hypothetical protein
MNPMRHEKPRQEIKKIKSPGIARRGWLRYGNPPGDPTRAPRCGAKTRRGTSCQGPAMPNGRCRMHGGLSTGPRTKKGLERSRKARWKHGKRSRARLAKKRDLRLLFGHLKGELG